MSIQPGQQLAVVATGPDTCVQPALVGEPIDDASVAGLAQVFKVLRDAGIIVSERHGTWVYYRLVPAALERMAALLSLTAS